MIRINGLKYGIEKFTQKAKQKDRNIFKIYEKAVKRHRSVETLKSTSKKNSKHRIKRTDKNFQN